jgi:hypothetical protein
LTRARGVWLQFLEPTDLDLIDRLRGKVGMIFAVNGTDRTDAIRKAKDFLPLLADPGKPRWTSPFVTRWQISRLLPAQSIISAPCVRLGDPLEWFTWSDWFKYSTDPNVRERFLVNIHGVYFDRDGLVYAGNRFSVDAPGRWAIHLAHDAPARLFVDGACVLTEPKRSDPAGNHSRVMVEFSAGEHAIIIAIDTDGGKCRGFYFSFEVPEADRTEGGKPRFPILVEKDGQPSGRKE